MSSKRVTELRKAGDLEEAYQLAQSLLKSEPENIWNKRAMSWVCFDKLKKANLENNHNLFFDVLENIPSLNIPEDEDMFWDNFRWQVGKFVISLKADDTSMINRILNKVFDCIRNLISQSTSESYSFLLKSFLKHGIEWNSILDFLDWWDLKFFAERDFESETYNDKKLPSLVERYINAYSKKLLEGIPSSDVLDIFNNKKVIDKPRVNQFLITLDKLTANKYNYKYAAYYKTKLLISIDKIGEAQQSIIPFAKRNSGEFWVWDLIADLQKDNDLKVACYSRALSCRAHDKFLNKVRIKLISVLIENRYYNEAKTEVEIVKNVCNTNGWKLQNSIAELINSPWFKEAQDFNNNSMFYRKHSNLADSMLYRDLKEELIVVEFVNRDKKILNFVHSESRYGFLKYSKFSFNPHVGMILKVRLKGEKNAGRFELLTVAKAGKNQIDELKSLKKVKGEISIKNGNKFGFVDDIFVSPELVKTNQLLDGVKIKGKAIMSYNKKKKVWGWKLISIKS